MRPLTNVEWSNFKLVVKCRWRECAFGDGLAGYGSCLQHGNWHKTRCKKFITVKDYEKKHNPADSR